MMFARANSQTALQMFNFMPPPTPNNIISNYSPNSFARQPPNTSYFSGGGTSTNLCTRNSQHNEEENEENTVILLRMEWKYF